MNIATRIRHWSFVFILFLSLPAQAAPGAAVSRAPHTGEWFIEILVLRPLGFARTVAGFPFFVAATPFMAFRDGGIEEAWNFFVDVPIENTFEREIGDF